LSLVNTQLNKTRPRTGHRTRAHPCLEFGVLRQQLPPPPLGPQEGPGIGLLKGSRGRLFLMSEVPLYGLAFRVWVQANQGEARTPVLSLGCCGSGFPPPSETVCVVSC